MSDIAFLNAAPSIDGAFSLTCSATSLACDSASVGECVVDLAASAGQAAPMRSAAKRKAPTAYPLISFALRNMMRSSFDVDRTTLN